MKRIRTGMAAGLAVALALLPAAAGQTDRIVTATFRSLSLGREKTFTVVLPESAPPAGGRPVLYLLHGRGRNHRSLVENAATRRELLAAPFVIVLPDGEDGWYIDSPVVTADRYGAYLEEVIAEAEARFSAGLPPARRAIAGWSMGGYGAVRFAETHPRDFAAVIAIIGLVDFPRAADLPPGQNYTVPIRRFGGDPAVWRRFNPIAGVAALRGSRVLLLTGRRSFDRTMNENFQKAAAAGGVDCRLVEIDGAHTLETVTAALPAALRFAASALGAIPERR